MVTIFNNLDVDVLWLIKVFITLFTTVVFCQSGFDKLLHWADNETFLKAHQAKSPLSGLMHFIIPILTLMEVATGICAAWGSLALFLQNDTTAFISLVMANICLICLLIGQRLAKDYAGAAALLPYFILTIFGLFIYSR